MAKKSTKVPVIRIEVPRGHGKRWWRALSAIQKKALSYPRIADGESNKAIAESYGISPNSIASKRDDWNKSDKSDRYKVVWIGESSRSPPKGPLLVHDNPRPPSRRRKPKDPFEEEILAAADAIPLQEVGGDQDVAPLAPEPLIRVRVPLPEWPSAEEVWGDAAAPPRRLARHNEVQCEWDPGLRSEQCIAAAVVEMRIAVEGGHAHVCVCAYHQRVIAHEKVGGTVIRTIE